MRVVNKHLLSPLIGCTAMQRLSIYADNVDVFETYEARFGCCSGDSRDFGNASGLQVNYGKSSTTLIRGSEDDKLLTGTILGCPLVNFPIKYLGLQLVLRPLTKAQWQPALDKIINFMPAWQRGMIARKGRLILIKTVVAAKPMHQLMVAEALVWMFGGN
jgi:hypothetical protein